MKATSKTLLVGFFALLLCGCGTTKTLYSWYDYDSTVHAYTKTHTPKSEQALMDTYEKLINKPGGTRNTIQPGICAEYGYLLLKMGKREEGLTLLNKEVELYPESTVFIKRIIKQFEK